VSTSSFDEVAAPTTDDTLLGGRIAYRQPLTGYRVALEAPLLAFFATAAPGRRRPQRIVDLGAGPGAVGLCLALHLPEARVALVDDTPSHVALARVNVANNGWSDRMEVLDATVATAVSLLGPGVAALVVANPPWFWQGQGASSPLADRQHARTWSPENLAQFLNGARQLLGRRGRLCLTFPVASLPRLFEGLTRQGLVPKRLKMLHPRADASANVAFVEAMAAKPGGLAVEPPWYVREQGETYTEEMQNLLWGHPAGS